MILVAVRALTPQAQRCLKEIHRRYRGHPPPGKGEHESPGYKLRMLTLEILEKWRRFILYQGGHVEKDPLGVR